MFAVIQTGAKQYRVSVGDKVKVEKLAGEIGETVTLDDVLMLGDKIGTPKVEGAAVSAKILEQKRDDKIIVFKKRRRKKSRRTNGHRQSYSLIEITALSGTAKKGTAGAAPAKKGTASAAATAKAKAK